MAMPVRPGSEVAESVLARPGRYQTLAENLQVKEVAVGEGTRVRRYAVCFNPQEAARQKAHREQLLTELEAELESLRPLPARFTASVSAPCARVPATDAT